MADLLLMAETGGFFRYSEGAKTAGEIVTWGTKEDILITSPGETPEIANPREDTEYYERPTGTGKVIRQAKMDKATYDNATGAEVAGGDAKDSWKGKLSMTYTQLKAYIAAMKTKNPIVATFGLGRLASTRAPVGNGVLIGYFSGPIPIELGLDLQEVDVNLVGGVGHTMASGVDYSDVNTAILTDTITPQGEDAITLTVLDSGDDADLAAGKIVMKDI